MAHNLLTFLPRFKAIFFPSPIPQYPFNLRFNSKVSPITNFDSNMAALTTGYLNLSKPNPDLIPRKKSRRSVIFSCQNTDPLKRNGEKIEEKGILEVSFVGIKKFGEGLRENLSPKRKGDWKDITLMSLSFAVYVYMSQKIVCAYCVWMSMLRQPW